MPGTNYLNILDRPACSSELAKSIYRDPNPDQIGLFNQVNGFSRKQYVGPGQLVVVPGLGGMSEQDRNVLSRLPQRANYHLQNMSPAGGRTMEDDFGLLNFVSKHGETIDQFSGGIETYLKTRTQGIVTNLKKLDTVYRASLQRGLKLNSPEVIAQRRSIEIALKQQITGISRGALLKNTHATSMKDMLGISHKSILAKQFKTSGSEYQVQEIADAVGKTSKLTKLASRVGMVGQVVSVGMLVNDTHDAYRTGGAQAASHTMGMKAAGIAGGLALGEASGSAAAAGTAAAMLIFGVGTGGAGFVVIGIAAVAGGLLGGAVGAHLGEQGYVAIEGGLERSLNWIVKAAE